MLAALAYWGFTLAQGWSLRILAGLGAPIAAAVVWGLLIAPKAVNQLDDPVRLLVEIGLFVLGGLALYLAGRPLLGGLLVGLFLVDRFALMVLDAA